MGGHKSIEYVDYWNTYYPLVSWNTVELMLVMEIINNWHIQYNYFVLECTQAPVKTDIYIKPTKIPKNIEIPYLPNFTDHYIYVYRKIKNL